LGGRGVKHSQVKTEYSGRRISLIFSYVIERGEGKMERARGSKMAKSLSEHVVFLKTFFPLLISTQSVAF
jgi:hypothetical protein